MMCEDQSNAEHLLYSEILERHPIISSKRPGRLFNSIQKIVAPTKASLKGPAKLPEGSLLSSYRRRVWQPRITRAVPQGILIIIHVHVHNCSTLPEFCHCLKFTSKLMMAG